MSYERSLPSLEFTPFRFSSIERRGPQASGRFRNFHSGPRVLTPRQRLERGVLRHSPRQRGMAVPVGSEPTLGFSLKPPKWLRNDARKVGQFVKKHETALLVGGAALTAGLLAPGLVAAAGHGLVTAGGALARGAAGLAKEAAGGAAGLFRRPTAGGTSATQAASDAFIGPPAPVTSNPDAYNGVWDSIYQNPHARAESIANDPEFAAWAANKAAGRPNATAPIGPPVPTSSPAPSSLFPNPTPDNSSSGVAYGGGGSGGGAPISTGDNPNTGAASPSGTPTQAGFPVLPLAIIAGVMLLASRKAKTKKSSTAGA